MSKTAESRIQIVELGKIATQMQRHNPKESSQLWQDAMMLAVKINDYVWMARIQQALGTCAYLMSNEKQALNKWLSAIKIGRAHGAYRVIAMSYINIGNIHALRGYHHSAMESYDAANQIKDQLEEVSPDDYLAVDHQVRVNMASVLNRIGEYQEAITCLRPLTDAELVYEISHVEYHTNWGIAHALSGDEEMAISAYEQAIKIAKEQGYIRQLGHAYKHLAHLHVAAGRFEEARQFYQKALTQIHTLNLVRDEIELTLGLTNVVLEMGELETADRYLGMIDTSLLEDDLKEHPKERMSYFDACKRLHIARGEIELALEASQQHTAAILAFHQLESQRQFADMKTQVEFTLIEQERKQTEAQNRRLAHLNAQKDILLEKMDVILSVFDHDLRNLLAAPALMVGMMQMKVRSLQNNFSHQDIQYLADKIDDMNDFINEVIDIMDLLSHVREFENNNHKVQTEAVSVFDVVNNCLIKQKKKAGVKSIQIEQKPIPKSWLVTADPYFLDRVLHNLVTNAIKYTPKGDNRTITVMASQCEDAVELSVHDEGLGLTDEDKRKLFTIGRLSARPTDGEATTGLGLYLIQQLAHMMGGVITANSSGLGKGSTFTITLPMHTGSGKSPYM